MRSPRSAPVPSRRRKLSGLVRVGDDQDVAQAGQHQRRQRIVDHRRVVDRHELLAHGARERVQTRTRAGGEDDPLHSALSRGQPKTLTTVGAALHRLAPVAMFEVPAHRLPNPFFEPVARLPAELGADLGRVDGVAAVVAGSVGNEGLQVAVSAKAARRERRVLRRRQNLLESGADALDGVDIRLLVLAAEVVLLSDPALLENEPDTGAVVLDVQPVAHVHTVAVDRQRPPFDRVQQRQRNQLLRKLVRPVVVGAVGDQHRQAIGLVIGAHEVVRRRLRRRVRRVRRVRRRLGEGAARAEAAVDLVGRHVQEAEAALRRGVEPGKMGARRLDQLAGADDVGLHEGRRPLDGAVDVRLGGAVDHPHRPLLAVEALDKYPVGDVSLDEGEARVRRHVVEAAAVAGVGQLVQDDDPRPRVRQNVAHEVRANEAGPPCDQNRIHAYWREDRVKIRRKRRGIQAKRGASGGAHTAGGHVGTGSAGVLPASRCGQDGRAPRTAHLRRSVANFIRCCRG